MLVLALLPSPTATRVCADDLNPCEGSWAVDCLKIQPRLSKAQLIALSPALTESLLVTGSYVLNISCWTRALFQPARSPTPLAVTSSAKRKSNE